jgi:flagellar biosynthesis anti-sigma factor FlgM
MEIPKNGAFHRHPPEEISVDGQQQPSRAETSKPDGNDSRTDAVRLTEKGLEYINAVSHARSMADTRADRVMELKRQLAQGTYRVMGERIAVKMIDESLENDNALNHIDTNV